MLIVGGSVALLAAGSFAVYKGLPQLWYKWFKVRLWDNETENKISRLHPKIRGKARAFLKAAQKAGYKLRVTSGYRSVDEQNALYDQGRSSGGKIVTNAKGGSSFHNFALAFDVVEIKDGVALWNNSNWDKIAAIGKKYGLEWGGDWTSFKDKPHFQLTLGYTTAELLAKVGTDTNKYVTV